ncbi:MAG: bi-domain-containing oxidoreductase [Candidatus Lokiarchaeia archaeon]
MRNVASLISAGTEKLMIDLAKKSLLGKAIARPDLVKQVITKAKTEGIGEAYRQAASRLDTPVPLGYSCAGEVIEVGEGVDELRTVDRVACFGSGYASHAEVVSVPKNLCVKIPNGVSYENGAFAGVGAIALHAVRTADPQLEKNIAVIGLGLLGLISVQLLKSSGCNVFGIDIDEGKTSLALELGADEVAISGDDIVPKVNNFSGGNGVDAVIIFASTKSSEPVELAAEIAREGAEIVVPGMVDLKLPRKAFYEKELKLIVSRAAGPGAYDPLFEQRGVDYPVSYVRWTEKRNMEAFLNLVAKGRINLDKLITHRFKIEEAEKAYKMLISKTSEKYIGVLFCYDKEKSLSAKIDISKNQVTPRERKKELNIGLIGAGLFAKGTILPILRKIPYVNLRGIATATGSSARHVGDKYGFQYCSSDYEEILNDQDIDCVIIATRHNLHAKMVVEALEKGKDVFVEKPLALSVEELKNVVDSWKKQQGRLMVGFNRRFSPFSVKAKEWLGSINEPLIIHCRVNAGFVPKDSWVHEPNEGGGRIIGEVCHFIDLIQYLTDSVPVSVYADTISGNNSQFLNEDNVSINVKLKNGSIASIIYVAKGDKAFPRERIEVFGSNSVCVIDNFKSLTFIRNGKKQKMKKLNVDRGHHQEFSIFFSSIKEGKELPVNFIEYIITTLTTFRIVDSIKKSIPIKVDPAFLNLD